MSPTAVPARPGRMEGRLWEAGQRGDISEALQQIFRGADPKSDMRRSFWGWTPLHLACEEGNLSFIKTLVETHSCDVERKTSRSFLIRGGEIPAGSTPLHVACWYVIDVM